VSLSGKKFALGFPCAERLWLAMAVATLWMVMLGGEAENQSPEPNLSPLPPQHTVC